MNTITLDEARKTLKTIPAIMRAYNLYQIDDKTKNLLIKEAKERGKRITEESTSSVAHI